MKPTNIAYRVKKEFSKSPSKRFKKKSSKKGKSKLKPAFESKDDPKRFSVNVDTANRFRLQDQESDISDEEPNVTERTEDLAIMHKPKHSIKPRSMIPDAMSNSASQNLRNVGHRFMNSQKKMKNSNSQVNNLRLDSETRNLYGSLKDTSNRYKPRKKNSLYFMKGKRSNKIEDSSRNDGIRVKGISGQIAHKSLGQI